MMNLLLFKSFYLFLGEHRGYGFLTLPFLVYILKITRLEKQ